MTVRVRCHAAGTADCGWRTGGTAGSGCRCFVLTGRAGYPLEQKGRGALAGKVRPAVPAALSIPRRNAGRSARTCPSQKAGKKPQTQKHDAPGLDAQAGKTVSATEEGAPPSSASAAPQKQEQGKNAPGPEPREAPPPMPGADEMDGLLKAGRILARAMWPHRAWLLQKTRVLHLCVYWTVTEEDAADTAVTYGRRIALFNTLLSIARDHLEIRSDSLRLEPDFTGEQKEKRSFSCQLRARAYIMIKIIRILLRRDPQSGQTPLATDPGSIW